MSEGEEGRLSEKEGWAWKENKGKSMGSLKMDGLRLTGCNSKQLWPGPPSRHFDFLDD